MAGLILVCYPYRAFAQSYPFLALGDSNTVGEKAPEEQEWSTILADTSNQFGYADINCSHALVTLLIGVNKPYRGYGFSNFQKEFEKLLQQAISIDGERPGHVLVFSIPDNGVTPFAKSEKPGKINQDQGRYNEKKYISYRYSDHFI